ncbi:hypothetical protein MRX96_005137 [Rhipicephalus microplus]
MEGRCNKDHRRKTAVLVTAERLCGGRVQESCSGVSGSIDRACSSCGRRAGLQSLFRIHTRKLIGRKVNKRAIEERTPTTGAVLGFRGASGYNSATTTDALHAIRALVERRI